MPGRRCPGTWWAPPPSKRVRLAIPAWRGRFPSTSAKFAPQALQHLAVGGRRHPEDASPQDPVMGATGGPQRGVAAVGENGEPFATIGRIDLPPDQAVAFESGDEVGRAGRAEHDAVGQRRHAKPFVWRVPQRHEDVELGDGQAVFASQLAVELGEDESIQHEEGVHRLPLVFLEELVMLRG